MLSESRVRGYRVISNIQIISRNSASSFILKTLSQQTKPENFHVSSNMQNYKEYSNPEQNRIDANFQRLKGKFWKKLI